MVPRKKIQDYTADAMREAMDDAQLNNLSIRGSAKLHNIPERTLRVIPEESMSGWEDQQFLHQTRRYDLLNIVFTWLIEDMGMQDGRYWRLQVICQRLKE